MCGGGFRMLMLMHSNKLFRVIFVTLGWPNCCFSSCWLVQILLITRLLVIPIKLQYPLKLDAFDPQSYVMVQTSMLCNMQMVYLTLLHRQHRFWLESWFLWWEENQRIQKQNLGVRLRLTNLSPCTMYKALESNLRCRGGRYRWWPLRQIT